MTFSFGSYANIPYVYGNYLPGGWANFSGQTHVFTLDPDDYSFNPGIGLNFNALGMLSQIGTFYYGGGVGGGSVIPNQSAVDSIVKPIIDSGSNDIANNNIAICKQAIESAKPKIDAMLQDEKLKDKKADIEKLKQRLEEQEKKLKELEDNKDLSPSEKRAKSDEIKSEINNIIKEASELAASVTTTAAEETPSEDKKDDGTAAAGDAGKKESQGATLDGDVSSEDLADAFHDAVTKRVLGIACTDDETFNAVCGSINKDNVTSVMKQYEDSYGNSFMEDFMWDADHEQKQSYGRLIARALRKRATELGIMDQCKDSFNKIFKELDNISIDNDIYTEFDNVYAQVAAAEEAQKSQA